MFRDEVSGDGFAYGVGAVGGYRLPLSAGRWFLEGEVGIEWHGGATEAQFAGAGISAERRQLGESWPDRWSLAKETSYGATPRVGGDPSGLDSRGLAVYLLAGVRFAGLRFASQYTGCFSPEPCDADEFESGRSNRDLDARAAARSRRTAAKAQTALQQPQPVKDASGEAWQFGAAYRGARTFRAPMLVHGSLRIRRPIRSARGSFSTALWASPFSTTQPRVSTPLFTTTLVPHRPSRRPPDSPRAS